MNDIYEHRLSLLKSLDEIRDAQNALWPEIVPYLLHSKPVPSDLILQLKVLKSKADDIESQLAKKIVKK